MRSDLAKDDFRRRVDDAVVVLFALVTESVGWATTALLDQDVDRANRLIAEDQGIDDRCLELSGLLKDRFAGGVNDPDELQDLIAVLQIVPELERSADLAEHIAQRTLSHLGARISPQSRGLIQKMSEATVKMWQLAGAAYHRRSRDASFQLGDADDELDALASELVSEGAAEGADPQVAVELALIARFYERLGDHAVNLGRRIDAMAAPRRLAVRSRARPARASASGSPSEKRGWVRRVLRALGGFRLVPTDEGFFELFEAAAANARECAEELSKLIVSFSDLDQHFEQIRDLERKGDQLTVDMLRRLDASFVTPYDREDIHALVEEIDDVVDDMFAAASMIQVVQVDQPLAELAELAEVLVAMADEMAALIACLRGGGQGARARLERIEQLERQGDAIFRHCMGRLFSGDYEALDVIKWKDIVQSLEDSLNAIEDVSDVVESILVKNS